jgi:hypothetical protein
VQPILHYNLDQQSTSQYAAYLCIPLRRRYIPTYPIHFVMHHPSSFLSVTMRPIPVTPKLPYMYKSYHLPSLILTARASCGKMPLKLGPSDQLFRSRRCVSKAGLMSH